MSKQSEKHAVTDQELAKLVAAHRKRDPDATAAGTIKALRAAGASFSGRRVRGMFAIEPAVKKEAAKGAAPAKGKSAAKAKAKATKKATSQPAERASASA